MGVMLRPDAEQRIVDVVGRLWHGHSHELPANEGTDHHRVGVPFLSSHGDMGIDDHVVGMETIEVGLLPPSYDPHGAGGGGHGVGKNGHDMGRARTDTYEAVAKDVGRRDGVVAGHTPEDREAVGTGWREVHGKGHRVTQHDHRAVVLADYLAVPRRALLAKLEEVAAGSERKDGEGTEPRRGAVPQ